MKKFYIKDNVCTPYKLILNRVSGYLTANGWSSVASLEQADTVIVGACAAFHSLENESVEYIKQAKEMDVELIVFGCLPNVSPESVRKFKPEHIIPSSRWEEFEKLIDNPAISMNEIEEANEFRLKEEYRLYDPGKQFVLIQTGCSSDCPYCPHKLGIGDLKSRPAKDVLRQIRSLVKKNVHTIVLTGNDTGSYGTDIGSITFPQLLKKVLEISPKVHLSQLNTDWFYEYQEELHPLLMNKKIKELQVLIQTLSERLLEIMNKKSEIYDADDAISKDIGGSLKFENVTFSYPGTQNKVLKNINFEVSEGQTVAIVGTTGSGKTTLTKLISRLYDIDKGRILIDGIDIRNFSLQSLRDQIAYIEQDIFIFSDSIFDNISFGRDSTKEQVITVAQEAQAHGFIENLPDQYNTEVGERGVQLSGGERQRVAIARAFLTDPKILILDDSSSSIDSETEERIQKAIFRILHGRTTFIITHRLSQIRWADLIIVLSQGEIVDQGSHEYLLKNSKEYQKIFIKRFDKTLDELLGGV